MDLSDLFLSIEKITETSIKEGCNYNQDIHSTRKKSLESTWDLNLELR